MVGVVVGVVGDLGIRESWVVGKGVECGWGDVECVREVVGVEGVVDGVVVSGVRDCVDGVEEVVEVGMKIVEWVLVE